MISISFNSLFNASIMKAFKHIIFPIIVILIVPILIIKTGMANYVYTFFILLLLIYFISGFLRYKKSSLSYFLSPYSFLHAKENHTLFIDLPSNLLFERLLAFYNSQKDNKVVTYDEGYIINAGTPFSLISWTENIIIRIEPLENGSSKIHFTSIAFSFFTWGKNEQNFIELKNTLEEALVI